MDRLPNVNTQIDAVVLGGGLDVESGPLAAAPGTCRYASNYEPVAGGGYERVGGYERFDGRPRPSDAQYTVSVPATSYTGLVLGDTVTGLSSGATGTLVYIDAAGWIAMTEVVGTFTDGEAMQTGGITRGLHTLNEPQIDGFTDNEVSRLAAEVYRADITKPTGSGPIRGVAVLGSDVFCWRDNALATAMEVFKATSSGWTAVALNEQVGFTTGTAAYEDGDTITQGANSATILRVVLESGDWGAGTAAGRFIITTPTPGPFAAGAATGDGACTLAGASAAITLSPGGRVETDVGNFTASLATRRLYGCDGVNPEFEFDGTVLVPLNTGMGSVRASFVKCHKGSVWFAYRGSLQKSAIGLPYQWSAVVGAAEIGTGDTITGLVSVGGSEAAAALIVFCANSLFVLYGAGTSDIRLSPLSFEAGATAYSAQDAGRPLAHDTPGFRVYSPTQSYGNFKWESASPGIDKIVREQPVACSVFVKSLGRYRCFFTDGSCMVGAPFKKGWAWMPTSLAHTVVVAHSAEVAGITRTFYGTSDGWVMEADVGRNFDGDTIDYALKLSALHQRSPVMLKTYRLAEYEGVGRSAYTLYIGAEYIGGDANASQSEVVEFEELQSFGNALVWGGSAWGEAQWGSGEYSRRRVPMRGIGVSVAPLMGGSSDNEIAHELRSVMLHYSPRRLARAA